ncbi:ElyC/SanA/YdcF family protein [Actinoplanes sp. NPDC026619]|uniref:ElyC/SanA/YdcF family protein n=1 Tax=Actinoplanes sp. NPDC026619 TaxID=3155798 RepID=UPI0033FE2FCE
MEFATAPGTKGLQLGDVAHLMVPGRGRDPSGFGLSAAALDRLAVARELYDQIAGPASGRIVCAGYKSPNDDAGTPWRSGEPPYRVFNGMPEGELMRRQLVSMGVPAAAVDAECSSIETVTNFLHAENGGYFGDQRPVAIVAQADHLRRILSVIAPRTLRRPYLGVVVPQRLPRSEPWAATLASLLIVVALPKDPSAAVDRATSRANLVWRIVKAAGRRR